MASALLIGAGIAAAAFAAKIGAKAYQRASARSALMGTSVFTHYAPGGFLPKMTKTEARQILTIQAGAPKDKIRDAHRRIMLLNHPDRGGSPYIALKINEAKQILETSK